MSMWPVEKAEEALCVATDEIGKALVADVRKAVNECKTFSAISMLSRRLSRFTTGYGMNSHTEGLLVTGDVRPAIWNKADELAIAEMPEAIAGFCERQARDEYMTLLSVADFLGRRRPKRNAELGDELMKRLAKVADEDPVLASRAAEFLNKGRRKTPRGDPLTAEVRKQCEAAREKRARIERA
jgi:hypothetical protein